MADLEKLLKFTFLYGCVAARNVPQNMPFSGPHAWDEFDPSQSTAFQPVVSAILSNQNAAAIQANALRKICDHIETFPHGADAPADPQLRTKWALEVVVSSIRKMIEDAS